MYLSDLFPGLASPQYFKNKDGKRFVLLQMIWELTLGVHVTLMGWVIVPYLEVDSGMPTKLGHQIAVRFPITATSFIFADRAKSR